MSRTTASRARRRRAGCGSKAASTSSATETSCISASTPEPVVDRARDRCRPRCLALGALVLLLAACATIAVRNPPRLDVTAVALDRVEGSDAYFTVDIALTNRIDQPIDIDALEATLSIEGEQVAQA